MTISEQKKKIIKLQNLLFEGRHKQALIEAEELIRLRPDNAETLVLYAWALLENGDPQRALEYSDASLNVMGNQSVAEVYRSFVLTRLGIYDSAQTLIDDSIEKQEVLLYQSFLLKARIHAAKREFEEALKLLNSPTVKQQTSAEFNKIKNWYVFGFELNSGKISISPKICSSILKECFKAIEKNETWFALFVAGRILDQSKLIEFWEEAEIIKLKSLYSQFQFRQALDLAERVHLKLRNDKRFIEIYKNLIYYTQPSQKKAEKETLKPAAPKEISIAPKNQRKSEAFFYSNKYAEIFSAKMFDVREDQAKGTRTYYTEFDFSAVKQIGVEVIFNNPFFETESKSFKCLAKWHHNGQQIASNDFSVSAKLGWDAIIFAQTIGIDSDSHWEPGQGKVEIFFEGVRVLDKYYYIGDANILVPDENKGNGKEQKKKEDISPDSTNIIEPQRQKSLEELIEELDSFTGLQSVKNAVRDFISYLKFLQEREKLGLKSVGKIAVNAVFLGNPGTGKTTIARLFGNIFSAMGLLEKGHVVEVDRAGLVGQYIGETAQKTEAIIQKSMGGILFIDEAYALVKKGSQGQDFGQEAIDTLLKRMEDKKGDFCVIAAGYPEEMDEFLNSNPGMKSRFTHFFNFEDYTPDEMITIFQNMVDKEDYKIDPEGLDILKKEFIDLYRKRDKTFGNARLVRKFFEDAKMQLSRRYISLPEEERTKETITSIIPDDIKFLLTKDSRKIFQVPVNEEALSEAIAELNKLVGLRSVQKDIHETIKLARYYIDQGEDLQIRFSSHVLFLGNPGTGKTTVARILSKIYAALGILPKGHLVETDRQGLVASYVGQTAEKTTKMIDMSFGGTLFIDEAYTLARKGSENDFGKEAIDTLLKRMEDDRGEFIVIAAGYTNEMNNFIASNPGIQSRFTKTLIFEDYTPDEMSDIALKIFSGAGLSLSDNALQYMNRYFNEIYRKRDEKFGNARVVRNFTDAAVKRLTLRVADLDKEKRAEIDQKQVTIEDLKDSVDTAGEAKRYDVKGDQQKLENYLKKLNSMKGLDSVKQSVKQIVAGLKIAQARKEKGLKIVDKSLHSVFLGNPGTGKTTIAKLLSLIYKELGLLEKGHLVEVDRSNLVAGFQGQTATKTDLVIKSALGGTLFIDEAYTLSRSASEYGQEAVDTLLKRMEDYKNDMIVIVAGYPNEMNQFLESNPGLKSRFTNYFMFEDYSPRQLLEIIVEMAASNGYQFDEGALQLLLEILTDLYEKRDNNFGNARTARNILHKAIQKQETRIAGLNNYTEQDLTIINIDDIMSLSNENISE